MHKFSAIELKQLSETLSQCPDFRVLKRLDEEALMTDVVDIKDDAAIGAILDVETTGKTVNDKIIELGLVLFAFDRATGHIYGVVDKYNGLEDPGTPIPPEATRVNNITDEMVAGHHLDDELIEDMLRSVELVIAHNAGFDRPICERRLPSLKSKAWACSYREIDWAGEGIASAKLDYIAYRLGFFFEGHRAEVDCMALLQVLKSRGTGGQSYFELLLASSSKESFKIWAVGAPYDMKQVLSAANYRWSSGEQPGTEKAWFLEVSAEDYDTQVDWVKSAVYGGRQCSVVVDKEDKFCRYSGRRPHSSRVYL